ncbi:MAG: hypothetical protein GY835_26215 [bacterium]|nr:hypothetical protein [bacterium]
MRGLMESKTATLMLLILGLLIRIVFIFSVHDLPLKSDPASYHLMATQLTTGEIADPYWPPGLPLYLAGVHRLFGTSELISRLAMLAPFLLFFFSLFWVLRRLAGTFIANIGLAIFILYPGHILHSITPLTQLPVAGLLLLVLANSIRIRDNATIWKSLFLGLSLGLLMLVRASCLLIAIVVPLVLYRRTRKIMTLVVPLIVSFSILGIWLIEAHEISNRFVFVNTANIKNMYYGNNEWTPLYRTWWFGSHTAETDGVPREYTEQKVMIEGQSDAVRDELYRSYAWDHIRTRPDLFLLRSFNRSRAFFAFDIFTGSYLMRAYQLGRFPALMLIAIDAALYLLLLIAFIHGLILRSKDSNERTDARTFILLLGFLYALPYFISFSHPTYHFPLVPLFALVGLPWLADGIRAVRARGIKNEVNLIKRSGHRTWLYATLVLVAVYIQIEWIIISALAP